MDVLSYLGREDYKELSKVPRIQFLYFHHVFPDEAKNFEYIVSQLAKDHSFIPHSEAVQRLISGTVDRPYISWSSDDGLENNRIAGEILAQYGASACFFVNPNSIGLSDHDAVTDFCTRRLAMPATSFLDWKGVEALLEMGHEIGSHTMDHDRVTELDIEQFRDDLIQSKEILERYCGPVHHFAYPYGTFNDFNKAAFDFVFETGYDSCSTAVRGCHLPTQGLTKEKLFIRRDQVIGAWPLQHIYYFMAQSAKNATHNTHLVPSNYLS